MIRNSAYQRSKIKVKSKTFLAIVRSCPILALVSASLIYLGVWRRVLVCSKDAITNDRENLLRINSNNAPSRRPFSRTLVGVLVDFSHHGLRYRQRFRQLLPLHPNVCSLGELRDHKIDTLSCELVYTFVIGAGSDGTTGLRLKTPFEVSSIQQTCKAVPDQTDCTLADMTLLNIKENMNSGKSPTWLAYGASLSETYGIDYIAKQDTDTIIFLDKYFEFARTNLPPAPFATDIFAGWFADKRYWPQLEGDTVDVRKFAYKTPMTLFAQGQFYVLSCNLVAKMVSAIAQHAQFSTKGFLEEHEDRDVTSAVLLGADKQLHFIFISREDLFWQHRVKIKLGKKFAQEWDKEIDRLKKHIKDLFGDTVLEKMETRTGAVTANSS